MNIQRAFGIRAMIRKKDSEQRFFMTVKKGEKTCLKHANVDYKPIRLNDN